MNSDYCIVCGAPIAFPKRRYCSVTCCNVRRAADFREKYHADPIYARQKNAYTREWSKANPDKRNATRRAYRQRRKAAQFARILEESLPHETA